MKTATLGQLKKLLELLDDVPQEQLQAVLGSGLLTDLLNANVADINRLKFRRACGLKPLVECQPRIFSIDCDADPFCPSEWKVEEHKKSGKVKWTRELVQLYLSENQKSGKCIQGHELRKELASKPVLNACVLDFLLAHPHLIPEEWKGKAVFFWGTIYRNSAGRLYVRFLYWRGGRWHWHYNWLGHDFHARRPAALSASI